MSKARKCDRCGRCFDPRMAAGEMASFGNPVFQDGADYQKHVVGHYLLRNSPPEETVDLCPVCTTQFVMFMERNYVGDYDGDHTEVDPPGKRQMEFWAGLESLTRLFDARKEEE